MNDYILLFPHITPHQPSPTTIILESVNTGLVFTDLADLGSRLGQYSLTWLT